MPFYFSNLILQFANRKKSKKLKKIQDKKSTPKKFIVNPIKKSMLTLSLLAILGVSIEMGDKK
ncbi:hypothetical protein ACOSJ1_MOIKCCMD_01076 [Enterococcus faecium]|nr:hypothetical protein ACOSJ1_MOIKCCMD_01076 [Enterococcus faecium]